jgi:hypothetical protein
MAKTITNSGELREFLVNMLIGVKNGEVEADKARNIVKLAAQVNESFYSEIKIAKTRMEAGQSAHDLGLLPINK